MQNFQDTLNTSAIVYQGFFNLHDCTFNIRSEIWKGSLLRTYTEK